MRRTHPLLLGLVLALVLFTIGFAVTFVWLLAAIVLAAWVLGFLACEDGARWYRW